MQNLVKQKGMRGMLRLMIVDDEEIIRNAIASLIDYPSIGYELVATARNGIEAYNIICDEYLDVVITDIRMPGLNGLELVERAVKTDEKLEFVILSGYSEFEYAKQAMRFGVKHYILKPTDRNQLIEALVDIRQKREERIQKSLAERALMLKTLQYPIERAFLIEGLQSSSVANTISKYQEVLNLPDKECSALFCHFIEEKDCMKVILHMNALFESLGVRRLLSTIAVTGSLIFVTSFLSVAVQEKIKENVREWSEDVGILEIGVVAMQEDTLDLLLEKIFHKISRYREICLVAQEGTSYKVQNKINTDWQMEKLQHALEEGDDVSDILEPIFTKNGIEITEAKNIALDIYMHFNGMNGLESIEEACDFFREIYSSEEESEIQRQLCSVLKKSDSVNEKKNNIRLLKEYVKGHLDSETLSLKWLAENYLFVNVQYLSRQFVKEEGERFSDYLTRKRMEEAKRLMGIYRQDLIKDIAKAVGFGNNPQYFSQVFKKYTGYSPKEYMEKR